MEKINSLGIKVGVVAIKKEIVPSRMKKKSKNLYNLVLTEQPLLIVAKKYLRDEKSINKINFVFDRTLSKKRRIAFNEYLGGRTHSIAAQCGLKVVLRIKHEDSQKNKILQIADYVASSISYWLEGGNDIYYKIIQKNLIHLDILDKKEEWSI